MRTSPCHSPLPSPRWRSGWLRLPRIIARRQPALLRLAALLRLVLRRLGLFWPVVFELISLGVEPKVVCAGGTDRASIVETKQRLDERHARQFAELADWCDSMGLPDQAARTRSWLLLPPPGRLSVALIEKQPALTNEEKTNADVMEWSGRFASLRQARSKALFELAHKAVAEKHAALAYQWVHEAVRENPNNEPARRLLGFKLHEGRWLTGFEVAKATANAKSKQVWHDRFGWLAQDQVPRYEAGERFYNGRWIRADNESRLRQDIANGWNIFTENYVVRTNHGLEEGVRLATRLERLHKVWRQVFVGYYMSEAQIARLFRDGPAEAHMPRRHQVVYYRNRDEYNRALIDRQPQIGMTTGYYLAEDRKAYFFAQEQPDDGNLYHEATHQLFSETRPAKQVGQSHNFWIVEGIACYMESLEDTGEHCLLGGSQAVRLGDARFRLLEDNFYIPLGDFTRLGMRDVQHDERIRSIYSQASGLAHFLMHYQDGIYRDALADYLVAIYANRDRANTLTELTDKSYPELDRQYREFISGLPAAQTAGAPTP